MARIDTLGNFLTDVAAAIRTKKGSEELIAAEDFDTEIENLPSGGGADLSEYFNNTITENTTSSTQFELIKKLPVINVDNNVTSLSYLFYRYTIDGTKPYSFPKVVCRNNVTDLSHMFASYTTDSIDHSGRIDLSGLDTSNVTIMSNMFENRRKLGELDFSTFDFSKVENIGHFIPQYSDTPTVVELKNFVGESLTDFAVNGMFSSCYNLIKVDLSNLNPPRAVDTRAMFNGCGKLEEIYIDSWDLGAITPRMFANMFSSCGSSLTDGVVTKVYVKDQAAQDWILALSSSNRPSTWTTDNVIIAGSEADLRNA